MQSALCHKATSQALCFLSFCWLCFKEGYERFEVSIKDIFIKMHDLSLADYKVPVLKSSRPWGLRSVILRSSNNQCVSNNLCHPWSRAESGYISNAMLPPRYSLLMLACRCCCTHLRPLLHLLRLVSTLEQFGSKVFFWKLPLFSWPDQLSRSQAL